MTRLLAASLAILALAFSACERHPLPGQALVTHTHGSGGAHEGGHGDAHAKQSDAHAPAAGHEAKGEQKPSFFPEKK